jgi:hypothetical protein
METLNINTMNTAIYILKIGNSLDSSTYNKIIAIHKDGDISLWIEVIKQEMESNENYSDEYIVGWEKLMLTSKDLFVMTEEEASEVYADLKSINLIK